MTFQISEKSAFTRFAHDPFLTKEKEGKKLPRTKGILSRLTTNLGKTYQIVRDHLQTEQEYNAKLASYGVGDKVIGLFSLEPKGISKRAHTTKYKKIVALLSSPRKTPFPHQLSRMIEQEARIIHELRGAPHIPRLYDKFWIPNQRYALIQQDISPTLYDRYLNRKDPFRRQITLDKLETISKRLLESIAYMHTLRILHGDIKPENCGAEGELFDFGLSEKVERLGIGVEVKYSRFYRPYETVVKKACYLNSDMWALGCLLFELFTGKVFIPVPDDKNDPLQADINMLHAFQQRFQVQYRNTERERFFVNGQLKPSKMPFVLLPLTRELAFFKGPKEEQFVDLLKKMLQLQVTDRISAENALKHDFFTSALSTDLSFKVQMTGKRQIDVKISSPGNYDSTITLSPPHSPSTCCHLRKSKQPFRFYFSHVGKPIEILHTCDFSIERDGETIKIDTDSFSVEKG